MLLCFMCVITTSYFVVRRHVLFPRPLFIRASKLESPLDVIQILAAHTHIHQRTEKAHNTTH